MFFAIDPVTIACDVPPLATHKMQLYNYTTVACLSAVCDLNNGDLIKMLQAHVQGKYSASSFVT